MAAPSPVGDPAAARDAARNILDGANYPHPENHWYSEILYVITHPIDSLSSALSWIFYYLGRGGSVSWVAWTLVVVVAIAIVFAVIRFTRIVRKDESSPLAFVGGPSALSVAELESRADKHEAAGEWAQAIRARYSAFIARLGEQGIVKVRAGRTIGEYQAEVSVNAPGLDSSFREASMLFEWIWYGTGEATQDDVRRLRELTNSSSRASA